MVKNPPAMQETQEMQIQSVAWENPLEEAMATHSRILAWEIPWMEESDWPQAKMLQRKEKKKKCCRVGPHWAERAQAGSKIRVEPWDSWNSQNNSEKDEQSWKTYLKLTMTAITKTVYYWHDRQSTVPNSAQKYKTWSVDFFFFLVSWFSTKLLKAL